MEFRTHPFRYGLEILNTQSDFKVLWDEVTESLDNISDNDIINYFQNHRGKSKSISKAINSLIKDQLTSRGWNAESFIFNDNNYKNKPKNSN
ncbi:hypothetical protein [Intestinibacter sp.]